MQTASIVHCAISVSDLDRSTEWYHTHFGFIEKRRSEKEGLHIRSAILTAASGTLEVIEPARPYPPEKSTGVLIDELRNIGVNHVAIGVEDIHACYRDLQDCNTEMVTELLDERLFFCKDPDGTLIEVKRT
jgi:methylmalonyl-CoA/ethylmalonyl-CoA epimerase